MPDRRGVPAGLAGLCGLACLACCALPALLGAGIIGGAGWVVFGRALPALAAGLAAAAAATWWWVARRRHHTGCARDDCSCVGQTRESDRIAGRSRL